MNEKWLATWLVTLIASIGSSVVLAQNVTITPLGAQTGEFCVGDRALLSCGSGEDGLRFRLGWRSR